MAELSVVIIVRNEERNILRCLASVKSVAAEIVVVDSGSTDHTVSLCREAGCRVFTREFDGYGRQKQFATDQAVNDWILSLDADEVLTPELQDEIGALMLSGPEQGQQQMAGYEIPFRLVFMGHKMMFSGVGKEVHLRLFNRKRGAFTTVDVHEGVHAEGPVGMLKGRILHYSYRDIAHHIEKINIYTSQAACGNLKKGKNFSRRWAVFKFPGSFFLFYIYKGGILDGYAGFMWSFLGSVYATMKVAKTIELNEKP
jgi:glycosyltransferase involved in cell wall biosynthesis